jgi:hypothetical protein
VSAKQLSYWDYDADAEIACPSCGWRGRGRDNQESYEQLFDVRCPRCDRMLLIVSYTTIEEKRAAAAAGNQRAVADLPSVDRIEARWQRAQSTQLTNPAQLPDLPGSVVRIAWDFDERDGEHWTGRRHDGEEIWRELAYWEGDGRYAEVFAILRERYGTRLAEVQPTASSELYLYGDRLGAPSRIQRLNASLAQR